VKLAGFYGLVRGLLKAGGIAMNGDHIRYDVRHPNFAKVAQSMRSPVEGRAVVAG
jgi:hypothetical protein